jgi:hypothetical protein
MVQAMFKEMSDAIPDTAPAAKPPAGRMLKMPAAAPEAPAETWWY